MRRSTVYLGKASINSGEPVPCQLTMWQEITFVKSQLPRRDPQWTFTDTAGHFHACDVDGDYPTLHRSEVQHPCDGTCGGTCRGQGFTSTAYACRLCNEPIQPGVLYGEHTITIEGLRSWDARIEAFVMPREHVTVDFADTTGQHRLFGVALSTDSTLDSRGWSHSDLTGTGPLGRRRAGTAPNLNPRKET